MRAERRKYLRVPLSISIRFWMDNSGPTSSFTQTLGAGGLFIESTSPLPQDTRIKIEVQIPGSPRPIVVEGKVVWVRKQFEGDFAPGMGIQYLKITRGEREKITEFILRVLKGAE